MQTSQELFLNTENMHNIGPGSSEEGFILIAVLWVSALLALFALYYSSSARVQGLQAMNTEKRLTGYSLLQSGIDWGFHQYRIYAANKSLLSSKEELEKQGGAPLNVKYPRYETYSTSIGNQTMEVQIVDLAGKVSINSVDEDLLRDILSACGVQVGVQQTVVMNSILDWKDKDNMHRQEGAEKEYYMELDPPYGPKNGPMESIEELLLIKGVDRELYQGSKEHPGLIDFFTVYGEQTSLDINSASPKALTIIEDFPLEVIEKIVAYRSQDRIEDMTDLLNIVPQKFFGQLKQYFGIHSSETLEIAASIMTDKGEKGYTMTKTYQLGGS